MNGYWRLLPGEHLQPVPPTALLTAGGSVDALTEAAFQESARADAKSAALLTIVGIGFTAFAAGCASAVVVPLRGPAQWLSVGALAGVCAVAELLLLALRPRLGDGRMGERYFAVWRRYADAADILAAELSAEPDACRTLIQLSRIVWRKYLLIRWAVDLLMAVIPVIAVAVSVALLLRSPLTLLGRGINTPVPGAACLMPNACRSVPSQQWWRRSGHICGRSVSRPTLQLQNGLFCPGQWRGAERSEARKSKTSLCHP